MEKLQCVSLDWPTIDILAKKTASAVRQSNYQPEVLIAIARGGVVPGRLICDRLHLKNFTTIKVDHWGVTAKKDGKAHLTYGTEVDLKNKKVLLVDDITDTGESIIIARDYLLKHQPAVIKTATLYHLKNSTFKPDYFGEERSWAWMIFPWNRQEDLVNLVEKILLKSKKQPTAEDLQAAMKKDYNLDLGLAEVEEIIDNLVYLGKLKWPHC